MSSRVPHTRKILVLALAGLLVACGGSEERKAKYMEEGKHLYDEGNYKKALLSYKNVLQIDPKDAEARYQLAESTSKLGEIEAAVGQYRAVIDLDPKHLMSRLRMGQIYLMVNQPDNAEAMAKEVEAIDPENIEGIVLKAGVQIAKKNTDAAYIEIDKALKKQPDDVQANLLKASLDARSGKMDEAIAILQTNSEKNPTKSTPLLMLAKIFTEKKDFVKAQQALEQIIKINPKELEDRKRLALFLIGIEKVDDAEKTLRAAATDLSDNADAKLLLIDFLVSKRTPEAAITELLPMIQAKPEQYDLRFKQIELELNQKHVDKAEQVLKEIVDLDKLGPQSIKARNRLARIYVATNRLDESRALIKQIIDENPHDIDALSLRGEFSLNDKKIPEAIGDFRAVLDVEPKNIKILKLLSTAHLMNNDAVLARESVEKIVALTPADEPARLELTNLLIKGNEPDRAIQQLEELIKLNPKAKSALEMLFKISLNKKDWAKCQVTANRVQEAFPDEGMGYFLSGLGFQAEGKFVESVASFEKALSKQPDAIEPLTQLIKSYMALKQPEKVLTKLKSIIKDQPKNFVAHNLLGSYYLNEKKYPEAIELFKTASTLKPEWAVPYHMLALTYATQNKKAEAIATFLEGIKNTKSALDLVQELAAIYTGDGDNKKALGLFEESYKEHPKSMEALNNLVSYASDFSKDKNDLERIAKLAEPLEKLESQNALDTVGWIAYQLSDYAKAQTFLLKVVTKIPDSPISNYHLGMIYFQQNDKPKAIEYLQKSLVKKDRFVGDNVAAETLKQLTGVSSTTSADPK